MPGMSIAQVTGLGAVNAAAFSYDQIDALTASVEEQFNTLYA
jgi:hypothetical protein